MSTLTEIKTAAAALRPEEMEQLETFLREERARQAGESRLEELYRQVGFRPLPRRSDEVVTTEAVLRLCEEEGV